ncbi:hypothetical protein GCM10022251_32230 [Phytohabitans flavus]|uniref:Uncharacterized protein n=1 Tax=Phytohabitans flavus TaxID=1076124 RepID=A0A6F8XWQ1_9ACTN|nr:hypothetical protein Pflav_045780 [Phytohabitans flavus]
MSFKAHVEAIEKGDLDAAENAFTKLYDQMGTLPDDEWSAAVRGWIEGLLTTPGAFVNTDRHDMFFVELVRNARTLILSTRFGAKAGFTDAWLTEALSHIGGLTATSLAQFLLERDWNNPAILEKPVRDWICKHIDIYSVNQAEDGLACRLLNLLWNTGDYQAICDFISMGIDTAQPAYYGMENPRLVFDGMHSGRVQPLEHVLGKYLRLASLRSLAPNPDDPGLEVELTSYGGMSVGGGGLTPDQKRQRGAEKVAGAKLIFEALGRRPKDKVTILTTYGDVEESDLITAFKEKAGTIWGFEHVRLPYVQAAHATLDKDQPLRMWELWETVQLAIGKGWYTQLLANPTKTIPLLVEAGVKATAEMYQKRPVDYLYWTLPQFEAAFRVQCESFLKSLAEQQPRAKYDTKGLRGTDFNAYMGALGCVAGLWWAQKVGAPVYYCLDGVKDDDVVNYKTLKTAAINTFLGGRGKEYVDGITIFEIREILRTWPALKDTVKFTRKGKFIPDTEIEALKAKMDAAYKPAWEDRKPPKDLSKFQQIVNDVAPELLTSLKPYDVMRVANEISMLELAATAESGKVMVDFLESKGCKVLYSNNLLPQGLGTRFREIVEAGSADKKKELAAALLEAIANETGADEMRIRPTLRGALIHAIKRQSA